jgi:hypothetical protein
MTSEERKAAFEGSALQALMKASGHEVCERCWCCDLVWENGPCWQCGGFEEDDDPEWPYDVCSVCGGEGELSWQECIGRCDDKGNHGAETNK